MTFRYKKYVAPLIETCYLAFVFFIAQLPLRDFDIWFHLKSGELFLAKGQLIFTEVFSYSAEGRSWTPFEWLFQIMVYLVSVTLGMDALPAFIAIFVVTTHLLLLRIFRYTFNLALLPSILLSFTFLVATYEFNTVRPHTMAYACLTGFLFLILARIIKQKKWIYFSPLLVLFWANIHSSGFLSWAFLLAFSGALLLQYFLTKKKMSLRMSIELALIGVINAVVTVLPPMGILDYQLLWHFFSEREFLSIFIAEWGSPLDNQFGFAIFSGILLFVTAIYSYTLWKEKITKQSLWTLPLLAAGLFGYTATRNVFIGMLAIIILSGWTFAHVQIFPKAKPLRLLTFTVFFLSLIFFNLWIYAQKHYNINNDRLYYPVDSTIFAKKYLNGRMFNDYNYGGYILYHMYPEKQVFIDGRADVYLCCEMRDYLMLAYNKKLPDTEYRQFLDEFWKKYTIDYAIIGTQKHNVFRRISQLLNNDPGWALVFWDDSSQVFVKRDGVNNEIIEKMEAKYATPYLRNPYRAGHEKEALDEYVRIDKVSKSARTSNAIGYILGQAGNFEIALERFQEAQVIDPTFESPYMNLAELAAKEGDLESAIGLYEKALERAGDRGLIYIRLGQLVLQATGNKDEARRIWENGVKNTVDEDARKQLSILLSSLANQK